MTTAAGALESAVAAATLAVAVNKAIIAKDDLTGSALAAGGGQKVPQQGAPKPFRTKFQDIPIQVDRPKGFKQVGKAEDGKPWERTYLVDYGYVPGVKALLTPKVTDDEDLDVYLGPDADTPNAHIALQMKADGRTPDELKVFLGWNDAGAAEKMFKAHTPAKHFGGMATMPMPMFKSLLGLGSVEASKALSGIAKALWSMAKSTGLSYSDRNSAICEVLRDLYPPDSDADMRGCGGGPYIVDTYEDVAVFEFQGKVMQVGYTITAEMVVTLTSEPVQVIRTYVPVDAPAKNARLAKALSSSTAWKGNTKPLPAKMKDHPATKAMPVETYDPKDVGGWHYVLEAKSESWVGFVDVDGRTLLWTHREKNGGVIGEPYEFRRDDLKTMAAAESATQKRIKILPDKVQQAIAKGLGAEPGADERYVLGIVLEPETVDGQGDVYSAAEIKTAAHAYAKNFRNVGLMHKGLINGKAHAVQTFIAPVDMDVEGTRIVKGTWLLGLEVPDDSLWQQIKRGELTGLSIGGFAKKTPVAA